jgi:hypothetical protein
MPCLVFFCWLGSTLACDEIPVPFYKEVFANSSISDFIDNCYKLFTQIFLITVVVEYLTVYYLLRRPRKARMQLICYLFFINAVTVPTALLAMLFIADPDLLGSMARALLADCMIELVVVTSEFGVLRWIFGGMYGRGVLDERVTDTRILGISLAANVASLAIGVLGSIALFAVLVNLGRIRASFF